MKTETGIQYEDIFQPSTYRYRATEPPRFFTIFKGNETLFPAVRIDDVKTVDRRWCQ